MGTDQVGRCPVHPLQQEYNPFASPQLDDPFPVWDRARREAPVFFSDVLQAFVVTRYDDAIQVLRQPKVFGPIAERKIFAESCPEAERILAELPPLVETNPVSAEPPIHTKLRRYLQPAFMPHRVEDMEPELQQFANELVDSYAENGSGNFYADYAYKYPLAVVCRLIGLPDDCHDQVKLWAGQRIALRYGNLSAEEQVVAAQGQKDYYDFTLDIVHQRRANPSDDFMSMIVLDSDNSDDPLTDAQLASQATTLLSAGHETTSHWLTMMLHKLLAVPERWNALVADPSSAIAVVDEALRTDGPAQSVWRLAKTEATVAGVEIPQGSRVSVVLASANADEDAFEDAEEFRLGRPDVAKMVAFGRGIHTCVGAGIARLEGRVTLEVLAERLPRLRLQDDPGVYYYPSAIQRMPRRLLVRWD